MSETIFVEKCRTYIDCHLQSPKGAAQPGQLKHLPAVTISRETGAGGISVAERLAAELQARAPGAKCPWTVFHKNLVERILEDHKLPARLAQFMPEDKVSGIADAIEEWFGLHPPSWNLVRHATETILHLAELGNVILVGRGANVITAGLDHVFHVRLVGSVEKRLPRVMERHQLGEAPARAYIRKGDAARARYVRKHFGKDVADPLQYHLVINTDSLSLEETTLLIAAVILKKYY
jgi:cytidylate kinase